MTVALPQGVSSASFPFVATAAYTGSPSLLAATPTFAMSANPTRVTFRVDNMPQFTEPVDPASLQA